MQKLWGNILIGCLAPLFQQRVQSELFKRSSPLRLRFPCYFIAQMTKCFRSHFWAIVHCSSYLPIAPSSSTFLKRSFPSLTSIKTKLVMKDLKEVFQTRAKTRTS